MASGTSRKTELKLVGVARASLEELLLDFEDYLLDQLLRALEQAFLKEGGITEKLYHARQEARNWSKKP